MWSNNAIWSSGSGAVSITNTLNASQSQSNNFGFFAFLNNLALSLSNVEEAATATPQQHKIIIICIVCL